MNEVNEPTKGYSQANGSESKSISDSPKEDKRKKRITWALEQARRDLVDATRRNRLLHAPLTGKRPWCLAVSGHDADDLLRTLYWTESFSGYAFQGVDEHDRGAGDEQSAGLLLPSSQTASADPIALPRGKALVAFGRIASSRYPLLQTRLAQPKLEKRLTKIFREERTLEEEQGLSTLFMATGFLKWFDSDSSEEASYAPLVLIPVTLVRVNGREGYLLQGRDDDIMVNVSRPAPVRPNGSDWNWPQRLTGVPFSLAILNSHCMPLAFCSPACKLRCCACCPQQQSRTMLSMHWPRAQDRCCRKAPPIPSRRCKSCG